MKTITFYSYKGGVGRTLLLANTARYLSRFGQSVFTLDFDLEAPGLHNKLTLGQEPNLCADRSGLVDYISSFLSSKNPLMSLGEHVVQIPKVRETDAALWLMPAGDVTRAEYWQRLAQINWHQLFYSSRPAGVPLFTDLKARIEREFAPDYLLIDSRTGITEMGGVATTLLPDVVVSLLLTNRENLEGAREVLRSINKTTRSRRLKPVQIVPVIARVPVLGDSSREDAIVGRVRTFMNAEAKSLGDTLSLSEFPILHSDPQVELEELVLVDGERNPDQSPLLRDYIRLFAQIIPSEILQPHIEPLVKEAMDKAWDDPGTAESNLLALAESCTHPAPHRALLKFYRVAKAGKMRSLRAAARYWELTGCIDDPLLWSVVTENFDRQVDAPRGEIPLAFIEAAWRRWGTGNVAVGLQLARQYERVDNSRAASIVLELLVGGNLTADDVSASINILRRANVIDEATAAIDRFKSLFGNEASFQSAWAQVVVAARSAVGAQQFLGFIGDNSIQLSSHDPILYANVLRAAGERLQLKAHMQRIIGGGLGAAFRSSPNALNEEGIRDLWTASRIVGLDREFEAAASSELGIDMERIIRGQYRGMRPF